MILSSKNLMWGAAAFAAFSLGGILALPSDAPLPNAVNASLSKPVIQQSETAQPTSAVKSVKSEVSASTPAIAPTICNQRCQVDVKKFQAWSGDIGRASEGGLDKAAEYAAYIRQRPALKERLITLAENQSDGDFSRLLVASFEHLEPQDKIDLSEALMSSSSWDIRRKTTSLLTSQDVLTTQGEAQIVSILSAETDPRVAMPILQSLGQSPVVREKPEIMAYISRRVANVQEPEIRGAALVAQTQLSLGDVTEMPQQVLESLQSSDPEYSSYGFHSADLVLSKLSNTKNSLKSPGLQQTKLALESIMDSEYEQSDAENDPMPERVYREATDLYQRYFR